MTKLIRDTSGTFQLPETLRQGQSYMGGTVQFDTKTGKPLAQGATTLSRPSGSEYVPPSYNSLVNTPAAQAGGYTPPALNQNNPTTSFTSALIQMLKEAQGRDTAGQASLMKQSQGITSLGLNDAEMNFRNKKLAPSAGTSLGLSAQNEFDPLQLSIANQQKLASQNLGNVSDLIKQTQDAYDKEQDRIERAKADLADAEYKKAALAETIRSNKASENISRSNSTKATTANMTSDIQNAVQQFQAVMQTKNWRGVNPDDYQEMADYIQEQYGTKGVAALKTAMNAVGIKVDSGDEGEVTF